MLRATRAWCTLLQGLLGRAIAFGSVKYRVIALPGAWPWARDRKKKQTTSPKNRIRAVSNFIPTLLVFYGDFFRS